MKKLLMIMIVILIVLKISSEELPNKPPKWFINLTLQEKWEYYKSAFNKLETTNEALKTSNIDLIEADKMINTNTEFLEKYKPYYPVYGINFGFMVLINKNFKPEGNLSLGFSRYFLQGKFFINPEINARVYNDIAVGLGLKFGFTF